MTTKKDNFSEFVRNWQDNFKVTWDQIPETQRGELERILRRLPGDYKGWRVLINEAVDQVRTAVGGKHTVAIIGPVNSGKSTLYNQLIRSGEAEAPISAVPGTTRQASTADAGIFTLVDTPGADAVGKVGQQEKDRAMEAAQQADCIILLLDATHGVRPSQQEFFLEVRQLGKPLIVALNKMDLMKKDQEEILKQASNALGLEGKILPISAKKKTGLESLLMAVARSEPGLVAALGASLPEYRRRLSEDVIRKAASTAAAVGATPLPVIDFIPLIVIQSAMVASIARIYDFKITFRRLIELIFTFGFGLLGRTLFYEISKFGGPPGWLVAAAIAAGITIAMGYTVRVWFESGERVSRKMVKEISNSISTNILDRVKAIGKKVGRKKKLKESISGAMDDLSQTGKKR
ncbi:MAG: GTP-binding protein [Anaerolineales bacterium]|nr:GTP-binding protein [Anaerolineales bacterium]